MTCTFINGIGAIVCSRGRASQKLCRACGRVGDLLCDHPLTGRMAGKTCSAPVCRSCATSKPDGKGDTHDLCPPHARMAEQLTLGGGT